VTTEESKWQGPVPDKGVGFYYFQMQSDGSKRYLASGDNGPKILAVPEYLDRLEADRAALRDAGVPCELHCPVCQKQHVDEGEWATTPHRTHRCLFCGHEWRPFEVATYGVVSKDRAALVEALEKIRDRERMPAFEYSVKWGEVPVSPERQADYALARLGSGDGVKA
jgi:hypothetical protein